MAQAAVASRTDVKTSRLRAAGDDAFQRKL
jgi:hypothetical protein